MNKLTIFWREKQAEHFYWCLDDEALAKETQAAIPLLDSHLILKADLACLADLANNRKVELVVSSNDVHFNQVNLPNKAQRHQRKAVPYLLEEQLSEPVEELFVALGGRNSEGLLAVRAIQLGYMQQLIQGFEDAEIKLDIMSVDLDLLKQPEDGYRVALLDEQVLLASADGKKLRCDLTDFSWLVQKLLAENSNEEELPIAQPMTVLCQSEEEFKAFEQQLPVGRFSALEERVESIEHSMTNAAVKPINLLQAEFETKKEESPLKAILTQAASLAGILLAAHLFYQGSQWVALDSQKTLLGKERAGLWKQAFPNRKVPSNPDRAMRSFLKAQGGSGGEGSFLALLDSSSVLIKDINELYPTNISYNASRNELRLDLIAKDLPMLNLYRDDLQKAGHQVDMSSATQRGDTYSSRLIIRR